VVAWKKGGFHSPICLPCFWIEGIRPTVKTDEKTSNGHDSFVLIMIVGVPLEIASLPREYDQAQALAKKGSSSKSEKALQVAKVAGTAVLAVTAAGILLYGLTAVAPHDPQAEAKTKLLTTGLDKLAKSFTKKEKEAKPSKGNGGEKAKKSHGVHGKKHKHKHKHGAQGDEEEVDEEYGEGSAEEAASGLGELLGSLSDFASSGWFNPDASSSGGYAGGGGGYGYSGDILGNSYGGGDFYGGGGFSDFSGTLQASAMSYSMDYGGMGGNQFFDAGGGLSFGGGGGGFGFGGGDMGGGC
jgi:hypothetical protein